MLLYPLWENIQALNQELGKSIVSNKLHFDMSLVIFIYNNTDNMNNLFSIQNLINMYIQNGL